MKQLVHFPLGSKASGALSIDSGNLQVGVTGQFGDVVIDAKVGYPVAKVLDPVKKNFVDKLKALIPGTWDDALIDKAWDEAVALVSEAPAAPVLPPAQP